MHPAYSVILFTTASGAGYGLMSLMIALSLAGIVPPERWLGFTGFAVAFALVTTGLLSSMFHLGRPERAWRAFSQWRTSWLSREGVLASATYVPAGLFTIGWVFFETISGLWMLAGLIALFLVAATVYCTAMIYASLKTIRQWHQPLVPPNYLALGLATGSALMILLLSIFGYPIQTAAWIAIAAFVLALAIKLAYWRRIDTEPKTFTAEDATGLGHFGDVRPFEPAHSRPNFVMREMGYQVARKHAQRLRMICVILGYAAPILCAALAMLAPGALQLLLALVCVASAAVGVAIERWLFFAEAKHVVMLYYGAQAA